MVKLSSLDPLPFLVPPFSGESTENLSCARLECGPGAISEFPGLRRRRGLEEGGENTSPGKALEMNK